MPTLQGSVSWDILMASNIGETISGEHGTAERDIGDGDPNVAAGNVSAGSGDISF